MSGEGDIRRSLAEAREPDPRDGIDCPVVALGQRNGVYYFLSAGGEKREMRPRDLTMLGLLSLFDGDGTWLHEHYAKLDKKDRKTGEVDVTAAAAGLIRRCADAGLWRLDTPMRGLGVWRDDKLGIVAHCGDALFHFAEGKRKRGRVGVHTGQAVYIAAPTVDPPAAKAASAAQAAALQAQIGGLWRFSAAHLPQLVFGFLGMALLGAAPSWHGHILLTGDRGSGKSTLLKLVRAALGPQANYWNDPTEAGLRELLTDEARALVYDEAGRGDEEEQRGMRIEAIIGLLRRMADEEGARSVRGTGSGARTFTVAGSAALAAVDPPALDAQDRSRILEIDMLAASAGNLPAVEQAIAAAEKLSPLLRARALEGWPRFQDNFAVFRQALIDAKCDSRQADQLGVLLAAAEMMASDAAIDSDSAAARVLELNDAILEYRDEDREQSNARRCWMWLVTTQIEHWRGGSKSTIGRLIEQARGGEQQAADALRVYGLRLNQLEGVHELWVANQHRGLDKVFERSPWRRGGWKKALLRLPGAFKGDAPQQFDGPKSRHIVVPERHLPDKPPPRPPVGSL